MGFGEDEEGKKRKKMIGLWEGPAPPRLGRRKSQKKKKKKATKGGGGSSDGSRRKGGGFLYGGR